MARGEPKSSRIPVPASRECSPERPRPDSPTIPKTNLRTGRGGEGLGFDPRNGVAVGGSEGRLTGSESGLSSDEEDAIAGMKMVDGDALGELNRLEKLARQEERRTSEE